MACAISAVLGVLHALWLAKGRSRDVGRRRCEIRVIQQIGKGSLKSQAQALGDVKCFGKTGRNGGGSRSSQNSYTTVPDWSRGDRIERGEIEHAAGRIVSNVRIADAVRALERASIRQIQVARVMVGTGRRCEIRTRLPQTHRADRPTAEYGLREPIHIVEKWAVPSHGKLIEC